MTIRNAINKEDPRREGFACFGEAAYYAQLFETQLENLLLLMALAKDKNISREKLEKIDTGLSRKSLGTLIAELKKHLELSPEFEELMRTYQEKRNYLMHDYFFQNAGKLALASGCDAMAHELRSLVSLFNEAVLIAQDMAEKLNAMIHEGR